MLEVEMTPITFRTARGRIVLLGGWTLQVPEVEPSQLDMRALVTAILDDCAGDGVRASREARRTIAEEYARARIANVRLSVVRYAKKYLRMFPDRKQRERLVGFRPEMVAAAYWPDAHPGRAGNKYAERFLREMGGER